MFLYCVFVILTDICLVGVTNSAVSLTDVFVVDSLDICADNVLLEGSVDSSTQLNIEGRSTVSVDLSSGEFLGRISVSSSNLVISEGVSSLRSLSPWLMFS